MKKICLLSTALLCLATTQARAEETSAIDLPGDFSANVALTSEYIFRGISQSNEEPTIQGGLDWTYKPEDQSAGLYLGIWGSGVDFEDATTEFDLYGGINGSIDKFTWDVGAIYYAYPGSDDELDYNFWEFSVATGYDFDVLTASLSLNYSPDFFAGSGDALYPELNVAVPLPYDLTASGSVGYQWVDDNDAFGVKDYTNWSLGLGYNLEGFDLSLKYTDTDLSEPGECPDGCSAKVLFSVAKTF